MSDTAVPPVPPDQVPPAPPVEPAPTPPPVPAPAKDLATQLIEIATEYQARLVAIKYGLFAPVELVNPSFKYVAALTDTDKSYLAERIIADFTQLEQVLISEMSSRVAALIGR